MLLLKLCLTEITQKYNFILLLFLYKEADAIIFLIFLSFLVKFVLFSEFEIKVFYYFDTAASIYQLLSKHSSCKYHMNSSKT